MSSIKNISFNAYSLQDTSNKEKQRLTRDIHYRQLPDKVINLRQQSVRDSFDIKNIRYSQKIITASGWLISDSETHLRTLRDEFMDALRAKEGNLDITDDSGTIRFTATVQAIDIPEEFWNITQLPFTIEFLCEPFGKATTSDTSNSWRNITSNTTKTFSITGTYNAKPIITMTVNSETNMTVFKLTNTSTGDWIQVEADFNTSNKDTLVINSIDETVKLNGADQDFTGVFFELCPNTNNLKIEIMADAFNIDLAIEYWPTYL